eukprot:CAMPEP_0204321384 /NCGR_PEP_ID=MMETSP0469-20131031/8126_1 /ASSEMBLY_ACC=CAM_ASM_000384 /TAXON_ID=2969 /ORGANISM="Oxyrrhis marina" /LENGTH=34 /DNA_ID= /DNA_START= /DNA_END= /DNA_ORIENTATION=
MSHLGAQASNCAAQFSNASDGNRTTSWKPALQGR